MMFSRLDAQTRNHELWEKVPGLHSFREYLYAICSPDGEIVYVGRSCNVIQRLRAHVGKPCNSEMAEWIDAVGQDNVCVKVLGIFQGAHAVENQLIKHLTANGVRLFNSMGVLSKAEQKVRYQARLERERRDAEEHQAAMRAIEMRQIGAAGICILVNRPQHLAGERPA